MCVNPIIFGTTMYNAHTAEISITNTTINLVSPLVFFFWHFSNGWYFFISLHNTHNHGSTDTKMDKQMYNHVNETYS